MKLTDITNRTVKENGELQTVKIPTPKGNIHHSVPTMMVEAFIGEPPSVWKYGFIGGIIAVLALSMLWDMYDPTLPVSITDITFALVHLGFTGMVATAPYHFACRSYEIKRLKFIVGDYLDSIHLKD